MARTSQTGYIRQYGTTGKSGTPAVFPSIIQFTLDSTQTTASTGKTLPNGSIPLFSQIIDTGVTGGTAPTVEFGTTGTNDGFGDVVPADAKTGLISAVTVTLGGALLGEALTADTLIFAGAGDTGTPGTGDVTAAIYYIMSDDGGA